MLGTSVLAIVLFLVVLVLSISNICVSLKKSIDRNEKNLIHQSKTTEILNKHLFVDQKKMGDIEENIQEVNETLTEQKRAISDLQEQLASACFSEIEEKKAPDEYEEKKAPDEYEDKNDFMKKNNAIAKWLAAQNVLINIDQIATIYYREDKCEMSIKLISGTEWTITGTDREGFDNLRRTVPRLKYNM